VIRWLVLVLVVTAAGCATKVEQTPESKAVAYLIREVPSWSRENQCFSCHNNGDAARALYIASRKGHKIPASALADTTAWLARPEQWKNNKGDPGFSDARLANLQFAAALQTAIETGHIKDTRALTNAVALVRADQAPDGSWPVEPANPIGSPCTYGTALATYTGSRVSNSAATMRWLANLKPITTPNAATILHFTNSLSALDYLRRAQTPDGGWGPYADTPPEPFDTALALLALAKHRHQPGLPTLIQRGRTHLIVQQQPDGSWPATTRPPGAQSYAQTISTTAWATLALLETRW
jgi:hypothetical protein